MASLSVFARRLEASVTQVFDAEDEMGRELLGMAADWQAQDEQAEVMEGLSLGLVSLDGRAFEQVAELLVLERELARELQERGACWLGTQVPSGGFEQVRVRRVQQGELMGLGREWNLFAARAGEELQEGLRQVSLAVVAVGFEQLRDARFERLLQQLEGLDVLPVVVFRARDGEWEAGDEQREDVRAELGRWAEGKRRGELLDAVLVADADLVDDEQGMRRQARQRLAAAVGRRLEDQGWLARSRRRHEAARVRRARAEVARVLLPWRQRLGASVERLVAVGGALPALVEDQLIGEEPLLRAGVRARFRADLLERVPLLLFPMRSVLGTLALTLGAWDRVVFASFGNLPSLVGSVAAGVQEWRSGRGFGGGMERGLRGRLEALLEDSYAQDFRRFGKALQAAGSLEARSGDERIAVYGVEGLEDAARMALDETIAKRRVSSLWLWLLALTATALFWALMSGPLVSIYRDYVVPLTAMWQGAETGHEEFPAPHFGFWMTALGLSFVPMILVTMVLVALACGNGRVRRSAASLREQIRALMQQRLHSGELRIEVVDPQLEAARWLMAVEQSAALGDERAQNGQGGEMEQRNEG